MYFNEEIIKVIGSSPLEKRPHTYAALTCIFMRFSARTREKE